MKKRDLAILKDLERFRVLSRDDIIDLHFKGLKQPITCCNTVLKRLRRDGYIDVNMNHQPYLYFSNPSPIKKDSAKIPHFLKIVEFYRSLDSIETAHQFVVEPKYGKGYMEPDAFMIWKRSPFFVEIQRSVYSSKVMDEKINRYESYFLSNEWQQESWQPMYRKVFPSVILVTNNRYDIQSLSVTFHQVQSINQLVKMFEPPKEITITNSPFKLVSG
jgi:hypothetical protein